MSLILPNTPIVDFVVVDLCDFFSKCLFFLSSYFRQTAFISFFGYYIYEVVCIS